MDQEPDNIERLRSACEAAREAYESASRAFGARLRAGETPTPAEWLAEETARAALVDAQQALRAAIRASASVVDANPPNATGAGPG